jgi:Cu-Zn family superoxide dismutase
MSKHSKRGVVLLSCMLMLSACEWKTQPAIAEHDPLQHQQEHSASSTSTDKLSESSGSGKRIDIVNSKGVKTGSAQFSQTPDGVKIQVEVAGLPPGKHGIHFHEKAVCEVPDFKTAGEHLNPEGKQHGFENPLGPHAGDLPNLDIGSDGKGKAEFVSKRVTLEKDKANSLLKPGGTSLIIHEGPDDYKTDPSGNSGARIACGAIH